MESSRLEFRFSGFGVGTFAVIETGTLKLHGEGSSPRESWPVLRLSWPQAA